MLWCLSRFQGDKIHVFDKMIHLIDQKNVAALKKTHHTGLSDTVVWKKAEQNMHCKLRAHATILDWNRAFIFLVAYNNETVVDIPMKMAAVIELGGIPLLKHQFGWPRLRLL